MMIKMKRIIRNFEDEWFSQHSKEFSEKYAGMYIGIIENKVVIVNKDFGKVFQKITKEYPKKTPRISYIPRKDELELLI